MMFGAKTAAYRPAASQLRRYCIIIVLSYKKIFMIISPDREGFTGFCGDGRRIRAPYSAVFSAFHSPVKRMIPKRTARTVMVIVYRIAAPDMP